MNAGQVLHVVREKRAVVLRSEANLLQVAGPAPARFYSRQCVPTAQAEGGGDERVNIFVEVDFSGRHFRGPTGAASAGGLA